MRSQRGRDFWSGLCFWVRGWSYLLNNRSLLILAIVPLLIACLAAASLAWILWAHLPHWVEALTGLVGLSKTGWLHDLLYYPLLISATLLTFISSLYVMYLAQALIAVPFYTLLADRTLTILGKKSKDSRLWKQWVAHSLQMFRVTILKTILLLLIGIMLFVFSFLPVLNIFALIGALMVLALDCMDYSLEALGFGFRRRIGYFFTHWAQWLGMALALGLTLLIPGLTLLVIPGAIAGAAIIVNNEKYSKL